MAWPTFTAGTPLPAASLTELAKHGNVWTTYTPTLTASVSNPTGTSYTGSGYVVAGKYVFFRAVVTLSAGVGTGVYSIALPPVTGKLSDVTAEGIVIDVGTGYYPLKAVMTTTVASLFVDPTTAGAVLRQVSPTVPMTFVSGDKIVVEGFYEAA
jgi:hypothetical protein